MISIAYSAARCAPAMFVCLVCVAARAADFELLTGVDATLNPGVARPVAPVPGPGFPGTFEDGDRLAGTSDTGAVAAFQGIGTPMFAPNEFGAMSFTFRRGSVPIPPNFVVPLLGVEFLGGPLLDLDGDLENGTRSLIPVVDADPVVIPESASLVELEVDFGAESITLISLDATGTNVGGPGIQAEITTTLNVLAGTTSDGASGDPINVDVDTRVGMLTPHFALDELQPGVYRIDALGFEIWQDSIDPASATAGQLGTIQILGTFQGWLVVRNAVGGQFPQTAGLGLGATRWPEVNTDHLGETFDTANGLAGGSTTIVDGNAQDDFTIAGNGGVALTDDGGDIGAYFDNVVVPLLGEDVHSFVYLESAGVGINNSMDPVFGDTVGGDVVIVAASPCGIIPANGLGDMDGSGFIDLIDYQMFEACLDVPGVVAPPSCEPGDADGDGDVDLADFQTFQVNFELVIAVPDCDLEGGD